MSYVLAVFAVILYGSVIYLFLKSGPAKLNANILLCIGFGILSAFLSLGLEYLWHHLLVDFITSHRALILLESIVGVSLIEEGSKWLWLVFIISRWRSFIFYSHGILYTCGIAAGFNLVEESLYAMVNPSPGNMILRSLTAIPVHFLFAIVMGFLFARYKLEGKQFLWFSLIIPVILHGVYDFFILQQYAELLIGAALLVIIGCLALSVWIVRIAVKADKLRTALLKNMSEV